MSSPRWCTLVLAGLVLAGCDTGDGRELVDPAPGATAPPMPSSTTSSTEGVVLGTPPVGSGDEASGFVFTGFGPGDGCDSPSLSWTGAPTDTVELAVTASPVDGGAPEWLVTGIDPVVTGIGYGAVPESAVELVSWSGACPPATTYRFTLWALTAPSGVTHDDDPAPALAAIESTPGVTIVQTGGA